MSLRIALVIFLLATSVTASAAARGGIGAIFGALIGVAVGNVAGKAAASRMTVEEALVKTTDQINKQLPMSVDGDTRWDSTVAGPGRRFTYHYTIMTMRASEIDARGLNQALVPRLRNGVCRNPDMQIFIKYGVAVAYSYQGSDGGHVTKIDITPRDCT